MIISETAQRQEDLVGDEQPLQYEKELDHQEGKWLIKELEFIPNKAIEEMDNGNNCL